MTKQQRHVSAAPLAAIPGVKGHPSTNADRPGSQTGVLCQVLMPSSGNAVGALPRRLCPILGEKRCLSYLGHNQGGATAGQQ